MENTFLLNKTSKYYYLKYYKTLQYEIKIEGIVQGV